MFCISYWFRLRDLVLASEPCSQFRKKQRIIRKINFVFPNTNHSTEQSRQFGPSIKPCSRFRGSVLSRYVHLLIPSRQLRPSFKKNWAPGATEIVPISVHLLHPSRQFGPAYETVFLVPMNCFPNSERIFSQLYIQRVPSRQIRSKKIRVPGSR